MGSCVSLILIHYDIAVNIDLTVERKKMNEHH